MEMNPQEFGRLLTEAIHRIKLKQDKLIEAIQDELGYAVGRQGGSAIEYWRAGNVPDYQVVEKLAREILQRVDMGRAWLEKFLRNGGFPLAGELGEELYPTSKPDRLELTVISIPARTYKKLVGRDRYTNEILSVLTNPDGSKIVAIDGMGGIGKSAIAIESIHMLLEKAYFVDIVWVSAAPGEFENVLTFDIILSEIAIQMDIPEVSRLPIQEKTERLRAVLHNRRALIVLDNLDTAGEPQEQIVQKLNPMLGYSKALLTSRRRFGGDIFAIHLLGLDVSDGGRFIQQEAKERNVTRLLTAHPNELKQIVEVTDGSPLAMKLVVGQLGYLSLDTVLAHLKKAQPMRKEPDQDEYVGLYRFIFMPSWELLSEMGRKLLISMAHFPQEIGGTIAALQAVSQINEEVLPQCIDELWRLSFLEIGDSIGVSQVRYYLHSLTRYFVRSDIVKL